MKLQDIQSQMFHILGKKIELRHTDDQHTKLKPGDFGIVDYIDDAGTIFVSWENGSKLGLIPGVDKWKVIY